MGNYSGNIEKQKRLTIRIDNHKIGLTFTCNKAQGNLKLPPFELTITRLA